MNEINCENALIEKMAEIDGEKLSIDLEQINIHLATCENCFHQIRQMQAADDLLKMQTRHHQKADLWSVIEKRIRSKSKPVATWTPFAACGVLLVAYKLIEMLPERELGWDFKFIPFVLIVALFSVLKENPFKINAKLAQGEI